MIRHARRGRPLVTWAVVLLALLVHPFTAGWVRAQLGTGNLVVERVGDGSGTLNGNSTPVFLQQFTTSDSHPRSNVVRAAGGQPVLP